MSKSRTLIGLVLLLYFGFFFLELLGNRDLSYVLDSLIVPTITLGYILWANKKSALFLLFLLCFAAADLFSLIIEQITKEDSALLYDLDYYVGNSLIILAYVFLSIKICKSLSFKYVLKQLKVHLVVLCGLNVYLIYVLQILIKPKMAVFIDFYLEFLYNLVIITLLSVALLNYFYRDNQKSFYLFIGALCIVFSEMIDVAYVYISQTSSLSIISTTLTLGAFYFFFRQSKYLNVLQEENEFIEIKEQDNL